MSRVAYFVLQQVQQVSFTSSTIITLSNVQLLRVTSKPPEGVFMWPSTELLNAKRALTVGEHQCPFVLQAHECSTQRVPEPSHLLIQHWTGEELAGESTVGVCVLCTHRQILFQPLFHDIAAVLTCKKSFQELQQMKWQLPQ